MGILAVGEWAILFTLINLISKLVSIGNLINLAINPIKLEWKLNTQTIAHTLENKKIDKKKRVWKNWSRKCNAVFMLTCFKKEQICLLTHY